MQIDNIEWIGQPDRVRGQNGTNQVKNHRQPGSMICPKVPHNEDPMAYRQSAAHIATTE